MGSTPHGRRDPSGGVGGDVPRSGRGGDRAAVQTCRTPLHARHRLRLCRVSHSRTVPSTCGWHATGRPFKVRGTGSCRLCYPTVAAQSHYRPCPLCCARRAHGSNVRFASLTLRHLFGPSVHPPLLWRPSVLRICGQFLFCFIDLFVRCF